ncbi:MAG: hypothetical protein GTN62_03545 [Gemmatimonadales bacterium]|nr:hypothetical protein [Gemmatimonadales bacterium]NIN10381.1 hypothetical protein [Gemmatimonadales bacterium]NIN49173.1 hypothetical protein [Gemmatimonadales bacterium]NIP06637.1 hypothetical protein [Gemmatimonadales bacterium]NIQ99967.1 hypothetical protein [Gemmatimonadales bacterium]
MQIDFTPFGFTPTESLAYSALLDRGPSSGYALAKSLNLARANVYQALRGLRAKGAAVALEGGQGPQIFRAVAPAAVLAMIAGQQAEKLDLLERQIRAAGSTGSPTTVEIASERQLGELTLRTAARAEGPVTFLAPGRLMTALLPVWRKRAADSAPTSLWVVGEAPARFPLPLSGTVEPRVVLAHFDADAAVLAAPDAAILARIAGETVRGLWSSNPVIRGAARATLTALTSTSA